MKTSLYHYCAFCLCGALALTGMAFLPPSAMADSLTSYGDSGYAAQKGKEDKEKAGYLSKANDHSLAYLEQAREFRAEGRYELARQRYLQALSICADEQTVYVIKRELNGIELLLRTMR